MNNDNLLEKAFKENQNRINNTNKRINKIEENDFVTNFTNSFVSCTLAEALEFGVVPRQMRFITNARKSGETVGNGTGLPAFYNSATSSWVDFMGNAIVV